MHNTLCFLCLAKAHVSVTELQDILSNHLLNHCLLKKVSIGLDPQIQKTCTSKLPTSKETSRGCFWCYCDQATLLFVYGVCSHPVIVFNTQKTVQLQVPADTTECVVIFSSLDQFSPQFTTWNKAFWLQNPAVSNALLEQAQLVWEVTG